MIDRIYVNTTAGRRAMVDEVAGGLTLRLTHIAAGTGLYTPTAAQTALVAEKQRVPISNHESSNGGLQLDLEAAFEGPSDFRLNEVGVFAETGAGPVLAFVWSSSDPAMFLAHKNPGLLLLLGVGLAIPDLPAGAVTIQDIGQPQGLLLTPTHDAIGALAVEVSRMGLAEARRVIAPYA